MALPKKKTSKSRTRRRFAQYRHDQKNKLERVVDRLSALGKPIIFDKTDIDVKKIKKTDKVEKNPKKSLISAEKVDQIKVEDKKVKKDKKVNKTDKSDKATKNDDKTQGKKDESGKWFNNIFNKKDSSSSNMKDLNKGGGKKIHRRKAI